MLGKPLPLRIRFFLTSVLSSLVPLLIAISIIHFNTINSIEEQIAKEAMHIASLASEQGIVRNAYNQSNPVEFLQPIAEGIRAQTNAAFVVFLDLTGKRLSHPDPNLVGLYFTGGDEGPALEGRSYTSKATGVSGPSIRAFAPIYNDNKKLVGTVAVGFFKPDINLILANIYRAFYVVIP